MEKVYQTNLSKENGDCTRACIASIFEVEIDEVPHFCKENTGRFWYDWLQEWSYKRGYSPVLIAWPLLFDNGYSVFPCPNQICWASVPSKNHENTNHAIVVKWNSVKQKWFCIHDPSTLNSYVDEEVEDDKILTIGMFVKLECR